MLILDLIHEIDDPRLRGKVHHPLETILFITLCAVLSGSDTWSDIELYGRGKKDWFSKYINLDNGIPSEWTFRRFFTLLPADVMESLLRQFAALVLKKSEIKSDQIAIDGKALCGSKRKDLTCLQSVTAWCHENGLVLAEIQTEVKSNEITAIPLLINSLEIKNTTVTIDAAGCQKNIVKLITDKKGDYVLGLKGNQPTLFQAAKNLKEVVGEHDYNRLHDKFDKSHGRFTRRTYFGYDASTLPNISEWSGAKSIIAVETISSKTNSDKTTAEWRYYLSSHEASNPKLPDYIRNHWGIENKLHWVLDVQMNEDDDQKAERQSTRSFVLIKRIALNIVRAKVESLPKKKGKKMSVRSHLKKAGWDSDYLLLLMSDL